MFETLEDQIKTDEQKTTTKRQRLVVWALIVLVSVVLFGALYVGIHFLEG
jgi:membrane-associated phospholipid phosphatase